MGPKRKADLIVRLVLLALTVVVLIINGGA